MGMLTRNHLFIYALLKKIFSPSEYADEVTVARKDPGYAAAIDLVEAAGADKLLDETRKFFASK
ncbi:MAG TPA: hypothetical protein VJJ82_04175 [Candidatus Nanoarchaeia archaeon]|nr:hypothetical protein [Candidatus Nanoarchaeia archaeon]